jgi:hypothetical protein
MEKYCTWMALPRLVAGNNKISDILKAIETRVSTRVQRRSSIYRVPRVDDSCKGITPYHRPIDSSRCLWLNRSYISKQRRVC